MVIRVRALAWGGPGRSSNAIVIVTLGAGAAGMSAVHIRSRSARLAPTAQVVLNVGPAADGRAYTLDCRQELAHAQRLGSVASPDSLPIPDPD
jgi:hypothetical protein